MNRGLSCPAGLLLVMGLALALSACVSTNKVMDSWVGQSDSVLVMRWGAPDSVLALPDGRKVLTWSSYWGNYIGTSTCRKSFTVDHQGYVENWSFNGCQPVQLGRGRAYDRPQADGEGDEE